MNAAESKGKPALLKQNDIISFYHIQMPRWLFADKRYKHISLEAKVAYSLLLNRHQLSKLNRWVNEDGEVYVIFSRNELAAELQISLRKAVCVFKELSDAGLVWETRRGHNKTNLIYLTRVELSDADAAEYDSAPFKPSLHADDEAETGDANSALPEEHQEVETVAATDEETDDTGSEVQNMHVRTCNNCTSGDADSASHEVQNLHRSNIYKSYIENSDIDCQSVGHAHPRTRVKNPARQTDGELTELEEILAQCDLWTFSRETAKVFENAIERLFFAESYKIAGSILPQRKVRSHLHELDQIKLQTAEQKISRNTEKKIHNTTAYTMAVIFNAIWETDSDVMNDPYLNSLRNTPPPGSSEAWREP